MIQILKLNHLSNAGYENKLLMELKFQCSRTLVKNSAQKWVRIIKSVKNLNDFSGQPLTYLVHKQY